MVCAVPVSNASSQSVKRVYNSWKDRILPVFFVMMRPMKIDDLTLNIEGDKTPWRLYTPAHNTKDWAVLWLQGFTSTIEGHAEGTNRMAEQTETTFAMLNYAGHGNHPTPLEDATRLQQYREVLGVYDELVSRGYEHIIAIGGSFGAYMAALLAADRPVEAIVLRAPAIYDDKEFELPYRNTQSAQSKERVELWRAGVTPDTPSDALTAVRNFTGDTFVIEHELDHVINPSVPKAYFAVAKHPNYIVIRGCDHSPKLMPDPQRYFAVIEQWITTIVLTQKQMRVDSKDE